MSRPLILVAFFLAHVPLGIIEHRSPTVAMAHAMAAFVIAALVALFGKRQPERVAYAAAYVVGGEVLWRVAGASIAWEFGKYAMSILMLMWMIRHGRLAGPVAAGLYFALLLPSAVLTMMEVDLGPAREHLSFTLSGPLALIIAVWFFSQFTLTRKQRLLVFLFPLGPLLGLAAITVNATLLNPDIAFGSESNLQASGGFGPNQVSAMLGLGALFALAALADEQTRWTSRIVMASCLLVLAVQCALTFSRGGLMNAGAAALMGSIHFLRDSRSRVRLVAGAVGAACLAIYLFPAVDAFTDGALAARFQDSDLTNRDLIVWADLQIWQEHPVMGVGPGLANAHREAYFRNAASHTEYTRMLAEHGLFGLASLVALGFLIVRGMRQRLPVPEKAVATAMVAWGLLFMISYGMRLAAPSFVIGLGLMARNRGSAFSAAPRLKHAVYRRHAVVRFAKAPS